MRKRVWWTWAVWFLGPALRNFHMPISGTVIWLAYCKNVTLLHISKLCLTANHPRSHTDQERMIIVVHTAHGGIMRSCTDQSDLSFAWPCRCAPQNKNQGFGQNSPDPFPRNGNETMWSPIIIMNIPLWRWGFYWVRKVEKLPFPWFNTILYIHLWIYMYKFGWGVLEQEKEILYPFIRTCVVHHRGWENFMWERNSKELGGQWINLWWILCYVFSFLFQIIGIILAFRYRNLKDPYANPSAFLWHTCLSSLMQINSSSNIYYA